MKYRFDKTRVAYTSAYVSAAVVMFEISVLLGDAAKASETVRYIQQLTYFITIILAIIAVNSLRKLIPKAMRRAVVDKFLYAVRKVARGISKISRRILRAFGINLDRYKKRKDEKSFIFDMDDINIFKKLASIKGSVRWKDLTENAEKIRFIYTKYMFKLIKAGYKLPAFLTPNEVKSELKLGDEDTESNLFRLYNGARYSGGSMYITDEDVDYARALVQDKKEKKK